jgi:hypothetical protein
MERGFKNGIHSFGFEGFFHFCQKVSKRTIPADHKMDTKTVSNQVKPVSEKMYKPIP